MSQRRTLQLILEAIPVGVVVVDKELEIEAFNPAAETITGIRAADAIGRPYGEVLQTHNRTVTDPLEEALATGQTFVNQRFYLRSDDEEALPIRHSASVLTDDDGEVIGGVTIFADISRQVALEQRLEGQRQYLRDVLRSIPDGVVAVDNELFITHWNQAAAEMTGRPAPTVMGRPSQEILGPVITSIMEAALNNPETDILDQQTDLPLENGETLPVNFSLSAIETPDGATDSRGGIIVFRDISDRLARQRELIQKRRYLKQVLDLAPYGIFTVDEKLDIQTFNRAAEALTGLAASFAIGKPYREVIHFEAESGPDPLPNLMSGGGEMVTSRLYLVDAGGKKIPVRYSVAALTDSDNQVMGGIAIFDDISDIVAAERTKNEFISMVSHELRTPLTSIKGFVTAVLEGRAGEINEKQKHFLSTSREQSNLLLNLINDLLDLSRLESGQIEIDRVRIPVEPLIEQAAESVVPLARRKQVQLQVEAAADLPYLWADRNKILQVLQNLLTNAIKFSALEGRVELRAVLVDPDTLLLIVRDNGIGITPADQERIFDPFYQVENIQTRRVGGTGLGLPIVKNIIEAHGGRIELESQPEVGSTFRIYLPLSRTPAPAVWDRPAEIGPESGTEARSQAARPARPVRLNPLVLVVDDDPATADLIQFTLEEEGYDVVTATEGQTALQLAAERQPDLITLDILMPEMDGYHVLDLLKKNPETVDIPVCIVSIIEDKVKSYRLGAIDYVSKPFESEQLLHAVETALQPSADGERKQILVVEDDPNVIELVEIALDTADYETIIAYDGVSGLEQLRQSRPALVLLDIMIPKIDGYEFIRQAKADSRTTNIPIIVLSVRTLEEDITRALRLGAEKYLTKGGGMEEKLTEAVQQVIQESLEDE